MNLEQFKEKNPPVVVNYILNAPLEEQLKYLYIPEKLMTDEFRVLWKLFFENNMFDFTNFLDEKTRTPVPLETLEAQYDLSAIMLKNFQMTEVDFFRIFLDDPMGIKMLKELALLGKNVYFSGKRRSVIL